MGVIAQRCAPVDTGDGGERAMAVLGQERIHDGQSDRTRKRDAYDGTIIGPPGMRHPESVSRPDARQTGVLVVQQQRR